MDGSEEWMDLKKEGATRHRIMEFHAGHKFLLLAHQSQGTGLLANRPGRADNFTP